MTIGASYILSVSQKKMGGFIEPMKAEWNKEDASRGEVGRGTSCRVAVCGGWGGGGGGAIAWAGFRTRICDSQEHSNHFSSARVSSVARKRKEKKERSEMRKGTEKGLMACSFIHFSRILERGSSALPGFRVHKSEKKWSPNAHFLFYIFILILSLFRSWKFFERFQLTTLSVYKTMDLTRQVLTTSFRKYRR